MDYKGTYPDDNQFQRNYLCPQSKQETTLESSIIEISKHREIKKFKWSFWLSPKNAGPSRDFSPNLKQDLSGLSGFFRQLRSKSCFKMSVKEILYQSNAKIEALIMITFTFLNTRG